MGIECPQCQKKYEIIRNGWGEWQVYKIVSCCNVNCTEDKGIFFQKEHEHKYKRHNINVLKEKINFLCDCGNSLEVQI
jgi:hypothetical protein